MNTISASNSGLRRHGGRMPRGWRLGPVSGTGHSRRGLQRQMGGNLLMDFPCKNNASRN
jgi:hypothetical protein